MNDNWQPIETAPTGVKVLVYGTSDVRFGVKDNLGNWRAQHHGHIKGIPTNWMHLPNPPQER